MWCEDSEHTLKRISLIEPLKYFAGRLTPMLDVCSNKFVVGRWLRMDGEIVDIPAGLLCDIKMPPPFYQEDDCQFEVLAD